MASLYDPDVASLAKLTRRVVNTYGVIKGLDSAPHCRACLDQLHRASKCLLITPQLHAKSIHIRNENLKNLSRLISLFYMLKYGSFIIDE